MSEMTAHTRSAERSPSSAGGGNGGRPRLPSPPSGRPSIRPPAIGSPAHGVNLIDLNALIQDTPIFFEPALGRVTQFAGNDLTKTIQYSYDAVGNRIQITDPEGNVVDYVYDGANRIGLIKKNTVTEADYDYDAAGRLIKCALGNGSYTEYSYDNASQLTLLANKRSNGQVLSSFAYQRDDAGNITQIEMYKKTPTRPQRATSWTTPTMRFIVSQVKCARTKLTQTPFTPRPSLITPMATACNSSRPARWTLNG